MAGQTSQTTRRHGAIVNEDRQIRRRLAAEIADALRYYRGSAHRKEVIGYIVATRRQAGQTPPPDLAETAIQVFTLRCGENRPFRLPFGHGSHRWALNETPRIRTHAND